MGKVPRNKIQFVCCSKVILGLVPGTKSELICSINSKYLNKFSVTTPLNLDALAVLDAIDRKGSFAAAAAALYRVPSAVTYTVQKLEQDLGITVFRREGRRAALTPAGKVLLEQGRELLAAAERVVETARQVDSGWESCFNIAVDSLLGPEALYPLLQTFYATCPAIEVNLYEEVLGGAWEALLEARADLVVGAPDPPPSVRGLRYRESGRVEWVFAVPAQHPLVDLGRPLRDEDIEQYRAVVVRDSSRHLPPLTRRVLERQPRLRVASVRQKISAQAQGLGVGFLPRQCIAQQVAAGDLVILSLVDAPPPTTQYVAWRAGDRGRALRWFLQRLEEVDLSAVPPPGESPVGSAGAS